MDTRRTWIEPRRIAAVGVALGLLTLAACGGTSASLSDAPPQGAEGSVVEMRLIAYRPATLDVSSGSTVTWRQQDAGFHTVTSGTVTKGATVKTSPDGTFDSGELAKGKAFTHTFDETGTFTYFCEVHPGTMNGQVTVQ